MNNVKNNTYTIEFHKNCNFTGYLFVLKLIKFLKFLKFLIFNWFNFIKSFNLVIIIYYFYKELIKKFCDKFYTLFL